MTRFGVGFLVLVSVEQVTAVECIYQKTSTEGHTFYEYSGLWDIIIPQYFPRCHYDGSPLMHKHRY
jgi:hypothetical protein